MSNVSQDALQWCNLLSLYETFDVNEMGEKKDVFTQGIACSFISILSKVFGRYACGFFCEARTKRSVEVYEQKGQVSIRPFFAHQYFPKTITYLGSALNSE